ncbi:MAG: hypothetical protein JXR07_16660 [Reichenbachiella sp.]
MDDFSEGPGSGERISSPSLSISFLLFNMGIGIYDLLSEAFYIDRSNQNDN